MGFKFEAIAVPVDVKSDVLKAIDLQEHETDLYCETGYAGGKTAKDYYILWMSSLHGIFSEDTLSKVGSLTDFYHLHVHEGVMYCHIESYKKHEGSTWSIIHFAEENMLLQQSGDIPEFAREILTEVRDELEEASEDAVDYLFDGPCRIFDAVTGYRYDFDQGIEFRSFIDETTPALQSDISVSSPKVSPWWKFW